MLFHRSHIDLRRANVLLRGLQMNIRGLFRRRRNGARQGTEENAAQDVRATLSVRRSTVPDRGLARPVPTPSAPERGTGEDGRACLLLFQSLHSFAVYLQAGAYRGRA